jgi:hypothetical protein
MGRLIDADKLKTQFPEPADWLDINQTLVHKTGIWAEIDAAETVPAIPLAWIKGYIVTCDLFDLRVIVPASKVIKTMVKIWEQENPGAKKGEQHETD